MNSGIETKKKIFFAAVELFAEKGYREVTMRDISKKVGIRPASIYNHYPSKEVIMDALLDCYLERMEGFYQRMNQLNSQISKDQDLESMLDHLMLSYEQEEKELMFRLTRIVHHEQFHSMKAADALIGSGYRKYMEEHVHFFDQLSEAGLISGKERNGYYGELFARISLTFATQFLHPEVEPTLQDQSELYRFVIPLIVSYEKQLKQDKDRKDT